MTVFARTAALVVCLALLVGCMGGESVEKLATPLPTTAPEAAAEPDLPSDPDHQRLVAAMGGEYASPALKAHLGALVARLAPHTDRPTLPYAVTILNTPAVNAFALPSGRVYVTRGLLALANDGAEVASVLAHEIAHVTANHALARADLERRSVLVNRVVRTLLNDPDRAKLTLARSQATIAGFSRYQEIEADRIGVRTLAAAGFDPYGAPRFLAALGRHGDLRARLLGQNPGQETADFLATHPSTPERIEQALLAARQFGAPGIGETDRKAYLAAIDGLTYGEDPAQGFVAGRRFLHPRLGFTFLAPEGFALENTPEALLGVSQAGLALRLDTVRLTPGLKFPDYLTSGWVEGVDPESIEPVSVNGFAGATAVARGTDWSFRLFVVRFGSEVYRFVFAARSLDQATDALFRQSLSTFRRVTLAEASAVKPLRLRIITARANDAEAIAETGAFPDNALVRFLVLNGLDGTSPLTPGTQVKTVVK